MNRILNLQNIIVATVTSIILMAAVMVWAQQAGPADAAQASGDQWQTETIFASALDDGALAEAFAEWVEELPSDCDMGTVSTNASTIVVYYRCP